MEKENDTMEQPSPISYKIIILGDSGVGKTSLIQRFKNDVFVPTKSTVGVDFIVKNMQIDHLNVRLNIIDTAGQQKYGAITRSYYKDVDAVILVYSLIDKSTFDHIQSWSNKFSENSDKYESLKVLVGTKKDLLDVEKSTAPKKDDIKNLMEKHKILFNFMTSAKQNINIGQVFEQIGRNLLESTMKHRQNTNILKQQQMQIVLNKSAKYKKQNGCC